jgi:hypothetical protein
MLVERLKPVLFIFAAVYIAVDELFLFITQPISVWLARQDWLRRVRRWIASLRPYQAAALFAVPFIALEPVKPGAVYLAATGHFALGATLFVGGELLKMLLIERLFDLTRDKLMSIPAFAWCYIRIRMVADWLQASALFQGTRRAVRQLKALARDLIGSLVASWRDHGLHVRTSPPTRRYRHR